MIANINNEVPMSQNRTEQLKQHFASRVTTQVRHLLDVWRRLNELHWPKDIFNELVETNVKLVKQSERFASEDILKQANLIQDTLAPLINADASPSSQQIRALNEAIYDLSELSLRKTDHALDIGIVQTRKPIILALNDISVAQKIQQQMAFFSIDAFCAESEDNMLERLKTRLPSAIIIDIDFGGSDRGIDIVKNYNQSRDNPIPAVFISTSKADLPHRLAATRAGGIQYLSDANPSQLISIVEQLTHTMPQEPYKVMIVEDSRSQAAFVERVLNNAGMITKAVIQPMTVLQVMEKFQPEIIIMDMYMPGCNGMELAAVIRQQERYMRVPILYLSGEEDREKQLKAMSQGGDDFLTKPVDPKHLIATINNRGQRARALASLIVRDSLTGLYNHTYTLERLAQECTKAKQSGAALVMAIMDIDHFKQVNDTYGHPVGDRVICSLALFLKQRLRKSDTIGRYGGEEFVVILPAADEQEAFLVLDNIRESFAQLKQPAGPTEFNVTFSAGLVEFDGNNQDFLVEWADQALYQAKRNGRNQMVIYKSSDTTPPTGV
jgi:diguanylate cyclase (GGDEF)-like protein